MRKSQILALVVLALLSPSSHADWLNSFVNGLFSSGSGSKSSSSSGSESSKGSSSSSSGSSKSSGNANFYFGMGNGAAHVTAPDTGFTPSSSLYGIAGFEVRLLRSRVLLDLGADGFYTTGKLDYDYTGSDNVHYTAKDAKFQSSGASLIVGLKIRLIDASMFRFYIGGGGSWGSQSPHIDASSTTLSTQGTKYLETESGISMSGYFGDAGIELGSRDFALRFAGRYHALDSGEITMIGNKKTSINDLIGYIAISTAAL